MRVTKSTDRYKRKNRLNSIITLTCNDGECYIDTPIGVSGIQIEFEGRVQITPTLPDDFIMQGNSSKMLIFTLGGRTLTSSLIFTYIGNIKILNFIACNNKGERLNEVFKKNELSWDTLEFENEKQDEVWDKIKSKNKKGIVTQTKYNLPDYRLPKVEKTKIEKTRSRTTTSSYTTDDSSSGGSGGY